MSGCGTRIVHRGQKPHSATAAPTSGSLHPPLAALTCCSISIICAFGLASAVPRSPYRHQIIRIAHLIFVCEGRCLSSTRNSCGIGRYSLVSGNSRCNIRIPTNHLQCLPQSVKVFSTRRDEGHPAPTGCLHCLLPIIKKLCENGFIPVQEPNRQSGWPLKKFDCGRSELPYISE